MPAVSPYYSRIFAGTVPVVAADGASRIAIKVRLRDVNDKPVAGRQVVLVSDLDEVEIEQPELTDEHGRAVGFAVSATPGQAKITAIVDAYDSSAGSE